MGRLLNIISKSCVTPPRLHITRASCACLPETNYAQTEDIKLASARQQTQKIDSSRRANSGKEQWPRLMGDYLISARTPTRRWLGEIVAAQNEMRGDGGLYLILTATMMETLRRGRAEELFIYIIFFHGGMLASVRSKCCLCCVNAVCAMH